MENYINANSAFNYVVVEVEAELGNFTTRQSTNAIKQRLTLAK